MCMESRGSKATVLAGVFHATYYLRLVYSRAMVQCCITSGGKGMQTREYYEAQVNTTHSLTELEGLDDVRPCRLAPCCDSIFIEAVLCLRDDDIPPDFADVLGRNTCVLVLWCPFSWSIGLQVKKCILLVVYQIVDTQCDN